MKLIATSRWFRLEWGVIISSLFLVFISLATLYSLELNQEVPDFSLLQRQAVAALIGGIGFYLLLHIDYRYFEDYAIALYVAGVLVLIAVLFFGVTVRGTRGWFTLASFTIQPVEFLKIVLIVMLAYFLSRRKDINRFLPLCGSLSIVSVCAALVYLQPDFGSMAVLFVIWFGMLFVMRMRISYILLILGLSFISMLFTWRFMLAPYQRERVTTFLNPTSDISGAGYNVIQSKIAVGSGRLIGRGLGLGPQSTLNFLPEQEADFIFSVISESLGFLGGALVIILYAFLLSRILHLALTLPDEFGALLAVGIFFWFAFQGFSNIAMNMGIAPVFGVPIPFLSYGGSSLLASILAIGILESAVLYSSHTS